MKFVKASLYLAITLAVSACSEQVSVESHLENAKAFQTQNKINESIIELKNAIRADNKNAEARFLLGQIYLSLGDGAAAVKELERAKQFKYDDDKVIPLLSRAYILTESDTDVIELSDTTTTLSNFIQTQYLAYKTLAAIRTGDTSLAKKSAAEAQLLEGNSLYTLLAQAYISVAEEKFDVAKSLLSNIFARDHDQLDALMLQGQLSILTKDYQQAVKSFQAYLALQPKAAIVNLLLSDALLKAGQYDEADKYADTILAKVKSQPFAHYIKAMVAFEHKDFAKASEHAEQALSADFNQINLKLVAGASAFYLENWQQSHHHLVDVEQYLPKNHQARRMLAITQLELGMIDEINTTIDNYEGDESKNTEFMSMMSYKLLELGATDEAKKLLNKSTKDTASSAKNTARQGILKLMMNDPSGIQSLEDAIALDPNLVGAEVAIAYAALQNNDIEKAQNIANKWYENDPKSARSYTLMASIAIEEKQYDEAESLLSKSLALEPENVFTLIEQLRVARLQNNESLSKERADFLIVLAPNEYKVLKHYFGVYQNEMALAKLQSAHQADENNINKALLVAEAMISLSLNKEAEALLDGISKTPKLPKRYWQLMITNYKQQAQTEKIQKTLENWMDLSPYHLEPIILLADLYAIKKDNKRAINIVNKGLEYNKDNLVLQLIQMQLLLRDKQLYPAKKLYKTLSATNIDTALKQGFEGRILLLEKEYDKALPKLITLYNAYPSRQNVLYVARAYLATDNESQAVALLEEHLKIDADANNIRTMLAGVYLKNDTLKAISSYEKVVDEQPNNVIAHNNLAWLYLEQNQLGKASKHAEKAYALAPDIANVADTYSKILLKSGDKRAALTFAKKAVDLDKNKDVDIQLNYIEALIANSRTNEAKSLLTKLMTNTNKQNELKAKLNSQL